MQCPKCGGRSKTYATKPHEETKQRYRVCMVCGHRFTTWEEPSEQAVRGYEKKADDGDLFGEENA